MACPRSGIPFASWLTSTNSLIAQTLLKVYCLDLLSSPEESNGETARWGYYFNDFVGVFLLLLTGSDFSSSSSLLGWQLNHLIYQFL